MVYIFIAVPDFIDSIIIKKYFLELLIHYKSLEILWHVDNCKVDEMPNSPRISLFYSFEVSISLLFNVYDAIIYEVLRWKMNVSQSSQLSIPVEKIYILKNYDQHMFQNIAILQSKPAVATSVYSL